MTDKISKPKVVNLLTKWIRPEWYKPIGQFFEVFGVIVLTSLLGLFRVPSEAVLRTVGIPRFLIAVMIIIVGLISFAFAIYAAYKAAEENENGRRRAQQEVDLEWHVISTNRLTALQELGVPRSVRSFLMNLVTTSPVGQKQVDSFNREVLFITRGDLVSILSKEFGPEVMKKVRDSILEYTQCDDNCAPDLAKKEPVQSTSNAPEKTANSHVPQLEAGTVNA